MSVPATRKLISRGRAIESRPDVRLGTENNCRGPTRRFGHARLPGLRINRCPGKVQARLSQ